MSYELKQAVVILPGEPEYARFLDLTTPKVTKDCTVSSGSEHWLADIPGQGLALELVYLGEDPLHDPEHLYALLGDPAIPCEESFKEVSLQQVRYVTSAGISGVGDFTMMDGSYAFTNLAGTISKRMGTGNEVPLGYTLDHDLVPKSRTNMFVYASNSQVLVAQLFGDDRFFILRKRDNTWRILPQQLSRDNVRAFGRFVAITERRYKRAIAAQLKEHPGGVNIDKQVMEEELSAGKDEWRTVSSWMGPSLKDSFANSEFIFPGRLHVFDAENGNVFTIVTNQGDSEILLIEDGTVYYRVSDRIYTKSISDKGLSEAHLLAKDESIRDAHWAFLRH
jgi:hypothetical protein